MRTIVGTMEKQEGKIVLADKYNQDEHFLEFKKNLSYIPEEPMLLTELTVMQHFQMYGLSYGISEDVLEEKTSRKIGRASCREREKTTEGAGEVHKNTKIGNR